MARIFLQRGSGSDYLVNLERSQSFLENPDRRSGVLKALKEDGGFQELATIVEQERLLPWGSPAHYRRAIQKMSPGDLMILIKKGEPHLYGIVAHVLDGKAPLATRKQIAKAIWHDDKYEYVYFIRDVSSLQALNREQLSGLVGRDISDALFGARTGFKVMDEGETKAGSVGAFLSAFGAPIDKRPHWTWDSVYEALLKTSNWRTPEKNLKQYVCVTSDQERGSTSMIFFRSGDEYRKNKPFCYDDRRETFNEEIVSRLLPALGDEPTHEVGQEKNWYHCEVRDWDLFARVLGLEAGPVIMEQHEKMADEYEEYKQLAEQLHLRPEYCAEIVELLREQKQIILEGPPGSGKTFVAEHIGRWLAHGQEHYRKWLETEELPDKVKERYEVVQFHESYGYEDFVQGFRPETTEQKTMVFERKPGVFLRFCEKARDQEGLWVMLIDEVNRGKPSKVFGELLFLLEYRNREISLSSGQLFSIPDNVVLIGTMNTADKSIALVDYALRRRFAFVPLQPVENGKAPVLESWMVENKIPNQDKLIDLFLKLNARVTQEHGEHFQVGHSYFMNKKLAEDSQFPGQTLSRIWKYQIQPLIREYSYTSTSAEIEEKYSIKQLLEYGKH